MSALPHEHLSYSQINQFGGYGGCQLAWAHKHVYKTPVTRKKGLPLLLGSSFDTAATTGLEHKIVTGENPDPDMLGESFLDKWKEEWETGEYEANEDVPTSIVNRGTEASVAYGKEIIPGSTPLQTQRRLEVAFAEVDWTLVGYVDLIEACAGGIRVVDHKATASSSTKYAAEADLQLGLYSLALGMEGEDVVEKEFRCARVLKTKSELVSSVAPSTPESDAQALDLLGMLAGSMESACVSGVFVPTAYMARSWRCGPKFCDFWESCDYGSRARSVG
jgi:hypothetical protein